MLGALVGSLEQRQSQLVVPVKTAAVTQVHELRNRHDESVAGCAAVRLQQCRISWWYLYAGSSIAGHLAADQCCS